MEPVPVNVVTLRPTVSWSLHQLQNQVDFAYNHLWYIYFIQCLFHPISFLPDQMEFHFCSGLWNFAWCSALHLYSIVSTTTQQQRIKSHWSIGLYSSHYVLRSHLTTVSNSSHGVRSVPSKTPRTLQMMLINSCCREHIQNTKRKGEKSRPKFKHFKTVGIPAIVRNIYNQARTTGSYLRIDGIKIHKKPWDYLRTWKNGLFFFFFFLYVILRSPEPRFYK
jgi:hypothetical protein